MTGQPAAPGLLLHLVPGIPRPWWCNGCMSSAGATVLIYMLSDTIEPHMVGEMSYCTRCDDPAETAETVRRGVCEGLGIDPPRPHP